MLERLNQVNDVIIRSVEDPEFASYGRIVTGYDFSPLLTYLEEKTEIPEAGNIYVASEPGLEAFPVMQALQNSFYFRDSGWDAGRVLPACLGHVWPPAAAAAYFPGNRLY